MRKILLGIGIISLNILLCSCNNSKNPELKLNLSSASYLNPDVGGTAEPIVVDIYELKTPYNFTQANYQDLLENPANPLGAALVDKKSVELRPGEHKSITHQLSPDTRYIGFAAAYRNIDTANWRESIELPTNKKKYSIDINLGSQGLACKIK